MPIRILSDEVASQIAAGEVVERPASVVKELVENALDAGARTVNIEIEGAGKRLVRVADDGAGIPAAELALAVARHATSTLASAQDLFHVGTLGFLCVSLASIASVSRLTLLSRAGGEAAGARLRVTGREGTMAGPPAPAGAPKGTVVTVEDLFYNLPARLKFLKSDTTERRQIDALVTRYALAYPAVRFRLTHDGRETFRSSGSGDRREALVGVFGVEAARQMLEVSPDLSGLSRPDRSGDRSEICVSGFISPPALSRSNRREITLFVNGRWVQDQRLSAAILQAYHTLLMTGQYPLAVILVEAPPEEVDVNVHPAKAEVRFRDPNAAFSAVQRAVRGTLLAVGAPVAEARPGGGDPPGRPYAGEGAWGGPGWAARRERLIAPDWPQVAARSRDPLPPGEPPAPQGAHPLAPQMPRAGETLPLPDPADIPLLRVIGQVGAAYVVAEGPDGLYLIDQHAAHERVLYEQFMATYGSAAGVAGPAPDSSNRGQALLEPAMVQLTPEQAGLLGGELERLAGLGFEVEPFGGGSFRVRAVPALLAALDPARALRAVVEDFEEDERPLQAQAEARLIARVCKRAAVKAGQVLSMEEQRALVRQLEDCAAPRTCPHGRPTMIHLSVDTLARQFGRR